MTAEMKRYKHQKPEGGGDYPNLYLKIYLRSQNLRTRTLIIKSNPFTL